MLQAINDRIKGWLGGLVIALITLPFALWGISSYFKGGEAPNAATVDGVKITAQELDNSVSRQKQELRKRFGDKLPFEDSMIKQQVLNQLINQKVLESYTFDNGYRVSDLQLFSNIKSLFSQDGKFDKTFFENVVHSRGQSVKQFEEELRGDIRVSQFSDGLRSTAIVTDAELEQLAKIQAQEREISLLKFNVGNLMPEIEVSDADAQAAYDQHADRYMTPEQVSVDYIELTGDQLGKDIEVDEQKVQQAYNDYVTQVSQNEQRKASHILIKPVPDRAAALAKLDKVKKALSEGKSFASLAKEYSDDKGSATRGGDLDWVEHGQMVKPFEDALFALAKVGDVSDVVETQFGLHLIRLDDIRKQKPVSLADKRNEIEAGLKQDVISGLLYDKSELMSRTSYENPDSLDATAEAVGLPVQKSELMTRSSGKGIAANPKVREAAFSHSVLADNLNSDIIELAPDHVVVLHVHDHIPSSKIPFEQVRAGVIKQLQRERALSQTTEKARAARDEILAGKPASSFVAKGITLDKPILVKRSDADKVNPAALKLAFEMAKPDSGKVRADEVALGNTEVAVVILDKVVTPDKVEKSQLDSLRQRRMSDIAISEYKSVLKEISSGYDIHKNPKVLE